jgi:hypothetical protein
MWALRRFRSRVLRGLIAALITLLVLLRILYLARDRCGGGRDCNVIEEFASSHTALVVVLLVVIPLGVGVIATRLVRPHRRRRGHI